MARWPLRSNTEVFAEHLQTAVAVAGESTWPRANRSSSHLLSDKDANQAAEISVKVDSEGAKYLR